MILLFRIFLIGLIFYLIFRSFLLYGGSRNKTTADEKSDNSKRISKETGEYVDYEEINK
jgi:hypothetical protein